MQSEHIAGWQRLLHETQDVRLPIDKAEVRHDRGRLSIAQGVFEWVLVFVVRAGCAS